MTSTEQHPQHSERRACALSFLTHTEAAHPPRAAPVLSWPWIGVIPPLPSWAITQRPILPAGWVVSEDPDSMAENMTVSHGRPLGRPKASPSVVSFFFFYIY